MAVTVTHTTIAVNGDHPSDPTILGQTAWNEQHTINGLGTMAEEDAADYLTAAQVVAGYQPLDSDLTALAALSTNSAGRSVLTLTDPNADRIGFWDDSAGSFDWLALGGDLSISGTTLSTSFTQSGTGATSRTIQNKLRETGICPQDFGATGDGSTNDWTDYNEAQTEAVAKSAPVYLPHGSTFNLSTNDPTTPVFGPGKILFDSLTRDGFMPVVYADRSSIDFRPSAPTGGDWLYTSFPTASNHGNTLIGAGAANTLNSSFVRSTVLGSMALTLAESSDRVEAIGQGALRGARFPDRCTAVGTLVMQFLGMQTSNLQANYHDFYSLSSNSLGKNPGDVGWDAFSLETRNPGISAAIAAITSAASSADTVGDVGVGRDALNELIKGNYNTAMGYKAHQLAYSANRNSAFGYRALSDGVICDSNTAVGAEAGQYHQQGNYNLYLGDGAGEDHYTGTGSSFIGALTGADGWTAQSGVVLLGYGAGQGVTPASNVFVLQNGPANTPLLWGDFSGLRVIKGHTAAITHAGSIVPSIQNHGTSASQAATSVTRWANSAGQARLHLGKSRGATVGSRTVVASADVIGDLLFDGDDGTNFITAALIRAYVDGTPGTNDMPGRLVFGTTADGAASVTEWLELKSTGTFRPVTDDGVALGDTTHNFSDLFGATGFVWNIANGNWVATHTSGILTVGTGDLRVATAGTNSASVVTVGGTQTLTNKTFTSPVINTPTISVADGSLSITGSSDATKVLKFEVDGFTTATTRTITVPDTSDTMVTLAAAQALSNKTSLIIGTASLQTIAGFSSVLQIQGTTAGTSALSNVRWSNNAGGATSLFAKSRGGSVATPTIVAADDAIMSFVACGDDGANFIECGRLQFMIDGTPGTTDMPGRFGIYTTPDGASASTERTRWNNAGGVLINDTSDADITIGLTINQGGNDNSILTLKSSDVAHGVTTVVETDTYASFKKFAANDGGLQIDAIADTGATGLALRGIMVTASTTKSTAGTAAIMVDSALKSGTGVASSGANANMVAFRDNGTTRFILDADGDSHQDVGTAWTNFDFLDDVGTLNAIAYHVARDDDPIKTKFNDWMLTKRERLQELGLVSFGDDGRPFMNMSKLTMLNTGAIRQITEHYEAKLAALENRLAAIEHRGTA